MSLKKFFQSDNFLKLFKDNFSLEIFVLIFPQFKNYELFKKLNSFSEKKIKEIDYVLFISLMITDNTDNIDYFFYKFNISKLNKKRILFLKEFNNKQINNKTFSKKNLWKIIYYYGNQSLNDLLYYEIFKSKKPNKNLYNLLNFFKDKETPIFPIKAKDLLEKYDIFEGKMLGIKLKKIEEKWIDNDFKISDSEVSQVMRG